MLNATKNDVAVIDMRFCRVFWDNIKDFPNVVLVPKKMSVCSLSQLTMEERLQLMREISLCEEVIRELFNPCNVYILTEEEKNEQFCVRIVFSENKISAFFNEKQQNSSDEAQISKFVSDVKRAIMIKMADSRFCQH